MEKKPKIDLEKIYYRLVNESVKTNDYGKQTPLKEFTKLVRLITDTHTCLITFVDLEEKRIYKIASSSQDRKFEEHLEKTRVVRLLSSESKMNGVSFEIAKKGSEYETDSLQADGGGSIRSRCVKKI